jgi:hypothetical protein
MLTLLAAVSAPAPASAAPACPIERAIYRHHSAREFTAGFARQDRRKPSTSDLAFWLRTPERTYWFSFESPNGYGGTYIAPDVDPVLSAAAAEPVDPPERDGDGGGEFVPIAFDAFASDLTAFEAPPQSTDKAPALIFARGLGPSLWYEPIALAAGDESAHPESMPIGFFERASCREDQSR